MLVLPEQVTVALAETPAEVADQVDKVATTLQPRFPADAAVTRLATAVGIETHHEWQIADAASCPRVDGSARPDPR